MTTSRLEVRLGDRLFIAPPHSDIIVDGWNVDWEGNVVETGVYDVQPWSDARKRAFARRVRRLLWVRRFARLVGADLTANITLPEPWGGSVSNNTVPSLDIRVVHSFDEEAER